MQIKIVLSMSIMVVLTACTNLGQGLNWTDNSRMASPDTEKMLSTTSKSFNQLALKSARFSSSPQPEWQRLDLPILPQPRVGSSLTLNTINKIALLFGGINSTTGELNDLWITDGQSWLQFHTPRLPAARSNASIAYDEVHQTTVLFGGIGNGQLLGDTWLFNGVDWIQQQPLASPSPRTGASIAYDAGRNLTILFGGLVENDEALNEMWVWDGGTWQQQLPTILPPARWGANMVYDQVRNSIVLFGGTVGGGFREDTWLWDGTSWIEQHPMHHPAGRADFGMAFDENRQQVILFGGQTPLDMDSTESWIWNGQDWTLLPTRQAPPKELAYGAQLVYLPSLQSVILYGDLREKTFTSRDSFTFAELSEVWVLTYRNLIYMPIITGQ